MHMIDASDPERDAHIAVVDKLIDKLAKPGVPVLRCYNKVDLLEDPTDLPAGDMDIYLCARSGVGSEELLERIEKVLTGTLHHGVFLFPYAQAGILEILHRQAQVLNTEYLGEGVLVEAICSTELFGRYGQFLQEDRS